jgi:hypothetical protein
MSDVEYDVKIIRRPGQQVADDYHATVTRYPDCTQLIWTSGWLWVLKWKTRRRALDRYFKRHDKRQKKLGKVVEFKR